jgi:UDP-N-acetylmuramoylalanine--D-glutamate ligase
VADADTFRKLLDDGAKFDVCVASPGISAFSDFYCAAQDVSTEVISELEFAWRESAADSVWACVTGTNGKTTTTALLAHIMQVAGVDAVAVGNIGDAAITAVGAGHACYIAECSSYQLASTRDFAPKAAVMLGITPDHIHWHKTHEHYAESKWRSIANLGNVEGACAILDATNDEVRAKVRELKAIPSDERGFDYIPIGTAKGTHFDMRAACGAECAAFASDENIDKDTTAPASARLTIAYNGTEHALCTVDELNIKGDHNAINALAAAAAAVALGASDAAITQALKTFRPLEHRIEPCGEVDGVGFYNDSKATNVDATLKALTSFPGRPLVVLFGGRDKGTDLAELVEACKTGVKAAICYGEGGPRFFEALAPLKDAGVQVIECAGMREAFDSACNISQAGDVVLLSPACASFDEFSCFEERGEVFKSYVANRIATDSRCEGASGLQHESAVATPSAKCEAQTQQGARD